MALPDPPFISPRIFKVIEPATGQYEVVVKMDTSLASKFPEKPFGTAITEIGLAVKDSSKYPDYVLVAIEPADKGGKDHLWVFQKLSGPIWPATTRSRDNLTPQKFRGDVVVVKTEQEVDPATEPSAMTGDLVSSSVQRVPNTGKSVLTEITETIGIEGPFIGQVAYEQRQMADVTEQLVADGTPADSGLYVVSSRVNTNGDGNSVKETVTVPSDPGWVEHQEVEWKDDINGHVVRTEQYVDPAEGDTPDPRASYRIINQDRSLKITEEVPTDALENYHLEYPVRISLDLPRVLKSVAVVWNESYAEGDNDNDFEFGVTGTSYVLNGQNSDSGNSSISLSPDVQIEWEDYSSNNLFATAYVFHLPFPVTEAALLAKLAALAGAAVLKWPVFKTRAHTITTMGQSGSVSVQTSAALQRTVEDSVVTAYRNQRGKGDDIRVNTNNGTVQIPPSIHPSIALGGTTLRSEPVAATATSPVQLTGVGGGPAINPVHTRSVTVKGYVSPTVLPATSPPTIPTSGRYLVDSRVQPYEYCYARVYAEVFNAANLA